MRQIDKHFSNRTVKGRVKEHFAHFSYVWVLILSILVASIIALYGGWCVPKWIIRIGIALTIALLLIRPLNAVYGLMGTSGSVTILFTNLILLCLIFSGIYYFGFFKTAGISYDINQPHVSYELFASKSTKVIQPCNLFHKPFRDSTVVKEELGVPEIIYLYDSDGIIVKDTVVQRRMNREEFYYQNIDYQTVLRNTAMTFLMQEPTDLFAIASTSNASMSGPGQSIDKQKTEQFHWILLLQVLIGWIFFGVFISILYNKFRYES